MIERTPRFIVMVTTRNVRTAVLRTTVEAEALAEAATRRERGEQVTVLRSVDAGPPEIVEDGEDWG
jgi:hypothetical protein